jgi:hypothetical protein
MDSMAHLRGAKMKMISLELREEMQAVLDEHLESLGYATRSDFIRDAILEKLQQEGIPLPGSSVAAPSRIGIGGKPTHENYGLNEGPINAHPAKAAKSNAVYRRSPALKKKKA